MGLEQQNCENDFRCVVVVAHIYSLASSYSTSQHHYRQSSTKDFVL